MEAHMQHDFHFRARHFQMKGRGWVGLAALAIACATLAIGGFSASEALSVLMRIVLTGLKGSAG